MYPAASVASAVLRHPEQLVTHALVVAVAALLREEVLEQVVVLQVRKRKEAPSAAVGPAALSQLLQHQVVL